MIWAIKDEHISTTFFDEAAARFFLDRIQMVKEKEKLNEKRQKYEITSLQTNSTTICGGALGPDWVANRSMKGTLSVSIADFIQSNLNAFCYFSKLDKFRLNIKLK